MSVHPDPLVRSVVGDLQRVFSSRLESVFLYGPPRTASHASVSVAALVATLTHEDLEACSHAARSWRRQGIDTPMLLPSAEFRRSLDAFPLEYAEMMTTAVVVHGHEPFTDITIAHADLRRACERQVLSHLLHLREGFIEARGEPSAIAGLVAASAPAFGALLRSLARLAGVTTPTPDAAALAGAAAFGLTSDGVNAVLTLTDARAPSSTDGARLFPQYLQSVEQLARAVDAWRP